MFFNSKQPRALTSPRRPSTSSLLPSSRSSSPTGHRAAAGRTRSSQLRYLSFLLAGTGLFLWSTTSSPGTSAVREADRQAGDGVQRRSEQVVLAEALQGGEEGACERAGFISSEGRNDTHRLVVRVKPTPAAPSRGVNAEVLNPDNALLPQPFDSRLTEHLPMLFEYPSMPVQALEGSTADLAENDTSLAALSGCLPPSTTHYLPLHPPPITTEHQPNLFFSMCTSPQRVIEFSPIWEHFMTAQEGGLKPGCLITDAQGVWDEEGKRRANEVLKQSGSSCVMKESSRSGQRYEMRVLGLVKDAWIESERRRWQEGGDAVEWFIFGDDDTWWSDIGLVRSLLAGYDSSEDWLLGSFSEATQNLQDNGPISYGGAGFVISRALLRKMQPMVDRCAHRFADVFGGDGLISNCAAWTLRTPLEHVVSEVPALRQMDLQGDASGYLASGASPYLTLHHWVGWLDLFPDGRSPLEAISLFAQAVTAVGGRNFLRRWIFDGGRLAWSVGYSVTVYKEPMTDRMLGEVEHTWNGFHPHQPSRPALEEGAQKLTYYLAEVQELSPGRTLFRHVSARAESQEGLREIDVVWDVSEVESEVQEGEGGFLGWLWGGKGRGHGKGEGGHGQGWASRPSPRIGGERAKRAKVIR